jgi:predicted ATPase
MKDSQDRATEVFSAGTRDSPQTAAAVIGRSFSFRLLTAICKIDVDELFTIFEKAQQMGIIVANSEGPEKPFTFSHELVRQTLLAGISSPRRQHLHAGVADAIERLYPQAIKERAGEVANHLIKAGSFADEQKLVRNLTLAENNALDTGAFEKARSSFPDLADLTAQELTRGTHVPLGWSDQQRAIGTP